MLRRSDTRGRRWPRLRFTWISFDASHRYGKGGKGWGERPVGGIQYWYTVQEVSSGRRS